MTADVFIDFFKRLIKGCDTPIYWVGSMAIPFTASQRSPSSSSSTSSG
ncbi:hypothetical protein ACKVEX_15855 [Rhodocyclaceae bacterium SMB388]